LQELNAQVMRLGSLVDAALAQALDALGTENQDKAGAVVVSDTPIDDLHLAIEERAFRALTLQQPLAGHDLRYLTALVPIAIDLERIGDEAVSIAQNVLRMIPLRSGEESQAVPRAQRAQGGEHLTASASERGQMTVTAVEKELLDLGQRVRTLLKETMLAFAKRDAQAARRLWEEDKALDGRAYVARRDVMATLGGRHAIVALEHDPHVVQRATCLLWIAYELERAADHCTNVCERIVFIMQGETDMFPSTEQ
jgi:phosphate transport system protein